MSRDPLTTFRMPIGLKSWVDGEVQKGNFMSRSEAVRTSIMVLKVLTDGRDEMLLGRIKDMLLREWPVK